MKNPGRAEDAGAVRVRSLPERPIPTMTEPNASRPAARPSRPYPLLAVGALALAPVLLGGCRAADQKDDSVESLFREQRYEQAYALAFERAAAAPDDDEAARLVERARIAYWMDEGRELVLAGDVQAGLDIFQSLAADGASPRAVQPWIDKCRRMLAEKRRSEAWTQELDGDFDGAARLYREAVDLWPEDEFARDGLERIEMLAAWRKERGADYYNSGIRDLRDLRMAEALRSFRAAVDFLAEDPAAVARAKEVLRMQAEERVQLADGLIEDGLFHAAAAELRHARILLDDLPGIDERIEAIEREVDVRERIGESARMLLREEADEAIALLEELLATTELQTEQVEEALAEARNARLDGLYERALELERDFHFADAIDAYDHLLDEAGDFHKDAISRRRTLASYIELAEELYGEYEAAQDDDARLDALRKIELFWPTYRDVPERIAELDDDEGSELGA